MYNLNAVGNEVSHDAGNIPRKFALINGSKQPFHNIFFINIEVETVSFSVYRDTNYDGGTE